MLYCTGENRLIGKTNTIHGNLNEIGLIKYELFCYKNICESNAAFIQLTYFARRCIHIKIQNVFLYGPGVYLMFWQQVIFNIFLTLENSISVKNFMYCNLDATSTVLFIYRFLAVKETHLKKATFLSVTNQLVSVFSMSSQSYVALLPLVRNVQHFYILVYIFLKRK